MRIVKPLLTNVILLKKKTSSNVAGSFAANVSRVDKDVNAIKEEANNMTNTDSKTATDAKPTFA